MRRWTERPREAAYLLNPAFCGYLLSSACSTYEEAAGAPLSYAVSFLVLPLVLHKPTRDSLPSTSRTSLPVWLGEHQEQRLGFAERVRAMSSHTKEALLLGFDVGLLGLTNSAVAARRTRAELTAEAARLSGEARECAGRARMVGGWLGRAGDAATVFALWGIRP